jgi:thiol-disulfide isomerase/thioredoxin
MERFNPPVGLMLKVLTKATGEGDDGKKVFKSIKDAIVKEVGRNEKEIERILNTRVKQTSPAILKAVDRALRVVIQSLLYKTWNRIVHKKERKDFCDPQLRFLLGRFCRPTEQDLFKHKVNTPQGRVVETSFHAADELYIRLMEILNEDNFMLPVMQVQHRTTIIAGDYKCDKIERETPFMLSFTAWMPDQMNPLQELFSPDIEERNRSKEVVKRDYGSDCYRLLNLDKQKIAEVYVDPKTQERDERYKLRIENKTSVINADTSCIVLNRNHMEGGAGEVPINMPLQITVGRGKRKFTLCSVVCGWDAHYTTLLNCFGKWYHYNDSEAHNYKLKEQEMDTETALKMVGSHGKMFFYYPEAYEMALKIERWDKDDDSPKRKQAKRDKEKEAQLKRDLELALQLQEEEEEEEEEEAVCPECAAEVEEDAEYCPECGTMFASSEEDDSDTQTLSWESEEDDSSLESSRKRQRLEMLGGGNHDNGSVIVLTDANFEKLTSKGKWFVDFYAPGCVWCDKLEPIWKEFAAENSTSTSVNVAKIDVTANPRMTKKFGIGPVPSIKFMVNGNRVEDYKGERTVKDFIQFVSRRK